MKQDAKTQVPRSPRKTRIPDRAEPLLEGRLREILDRATDLFDQYGYVNVAMEDIAKAVGVRKPTLYHYVRSRDYILFLVHQEFMDLVIGREQARMGHPETPTERLTEVIADILELMESHRGHVRVFFEHHRELASQYKQTIQAKRDYYESAVEDLIRSGISSGEFRSVDPRLAALALFGMCNWAYQWYQKGGSLTTREIAHGFADLLFCGIKTPT